MFAFSRHMLAAYDFRFLHAMLMPPRYADYAAAFYRRFRRFRRWLRCFFADADAFVAAAAC